MITGSIRALLLEYDGLSTKVVHFISTDHIPKNILIIPARRNILKKQILLSGRKEQHLNNFINLIIII